MSQITERAPAVLAGPSRAGHSLEVLIAANECVPEHLPFFLIDFRPNLNLLMRHSCVSLLCADEWDS